MMRQTVRLSSSFSRLGLSTSLSAMSHYPAKPARHAKAALGLAVAPPARTWSSTPEQERIDLLAAKSILENPGKVEEKDVLEAAVRHYWKNQQFAQIFELFELKKSTGQSMSSIAESPSTAQAFILSFCKLRKYPEALSLFTVISKSNQTQSLSDPVLSQLSVAAMRLGNYALAVDLVDFVSKRNPDYSTPAFIAIQSALYARDDSADLKQTDQFILRSFGIAEDERNTIQSEFFGSILLFLSEDSKNFLKVLSWLESKGIKPPDWSSHIGAISAAREGQMERALDFLMHILSMKQPIPVRLLLEMLKGFCALGKILEALMLLEKAKSFTSGEIPSYAYFVIFTGIARQTPVDTELLEHTLRFAKNSNSLNERDVMEPLTLCYTRSGQVSKAHDLIQNLLKAGETVPKNLLILIYANLVETGNWSEMDLFFAIDLNNVFSSYVRSGSCLETLGKSGKIQSFIQYLNAIDEQSRGFSGIKILAQQLLQDETFSFTDEQMDKLRRVALLQTSESDDSNAVKKRIVLGDKFLKRK